MGKLGGKARKFAKKNLQSLLKKKRKLKSMFKKKSSKRGDKGGIEESKSEELDLQQSNQKNFDADENPYSSLDSVLDEIDEDSNENGDISESDGYLSTDTEDESIVTIKKSITNGSFDELHTECRLSDENREVLKQLQRDERRLEKLKGKDVKFVKFLERKRSQAVGLNSQQKFSDDEGVFEPSDELHHKDEKFILSPDLIDPLHELCKETRNVNALVKLVNAYRAACHYGDESHWGARDDASVKIVMFMLTEADNLFRKILELPCYNVKENFPELTKSSRWETLKPLIKCYMRSSLRLLNDLTDPDLLTFTLKNLRVSVSYFFAFPSLLKRLVEVSARLWASGEMRSSQCAFLIIQEIAYKSKLNWFDLCLSKIYKILIRRGECVDPALSDHTQYLKNSFVDLCVQDIQKSYNLAFKSIRVLRNTLLMAVKTKKKEAIKKVCSLQFVNCIDVWVNFVAVNFGDYDLKSLFSMLIEVINGVALLFPGPRYLPLRVKCIKWLNHVSSSSKIFIPVTSLILNLLDYKIAKCGGNQKDEQRPSSSIKLPKFWLKSVKFQELCVLSTIQLLTMHFSQWSCHISFPELATIPLLRLRSFQETTSVESLRRVVKRFIDQVEHNIEYVQKRRDEVSFSPNDHQSANSFLQLEKGKINTPFMQYYQSILAKASLLQLRI